LCFNKIKFTDRICYFVIIIVMRVLYTRVLYIESLMLNIQVISGINITVDVVLKILYVYIFNL